MYCTELVPEMPRIPVGTRARRPGTLSRCVRKGEARTGDGSLPFLPVYAALSGSYRPDAPQDGPYPHALVLSGNCGWPCRGDV